MSQPPALNSRIRIAGVRICWRNHSASSADLSAPKQHRTIIIPTQFTSYSYRSTRSTAHWYRLSGSILDTPRWGCPIFTAEPRQIWTLRICMYPLSGSELHLNVCCRSTTTQHSITHASRPIYIVIIGVATRWPPWKCTHWARAVRTRSLTRRDE